MTRALDEALDPVMSSKTVEELELQLETLAGRFGFAAATYADMSNIPIGGEPDPYFMTDLPSAFVTSYADAEFAGFDPIIRRASASNAPFFWTDCSDYRKALRPTRGKKGRIRRLVELANDYSFRDGWVLPLHARNGHGQPRSALISLYWHGDPLSLHRPEVLPTWLRLIAQVYHERLLALRVGNDESVDLPSLTDRERECLVWACRGKTNGETGDILFISERTVEFHITNAMKKLGVYNKVHCVAVAVQLGLVSP